eukprot:m.1307819 g.1307819  ORF g.1307819 m.1307819 type:complete len:152 (+) comp24819_c0_seq1:1425-1880(+)
MQRNRSPPPRVLQPWRVCAKIADSGPMLVPWAGSVQSPTLRASLMSRVTNVLDAQGELHRKDTHKDAHKDTHAIRILCRHIDDSPAPATLPDDDGQSWSRSHTPPTLTQRGWYMDTQANTETGTEIETEWLAAGLQKRLTGRRMERDTQRD